MLPPESHSADTSAPADSAAKCQGIEPHSRSGRDTQVRVCALPAALREDIEDAPFWKEVVAFSRLPQATLDCYFGKYIAIYQGNIVDSDKNEGELALRFYRTFGYVPVYIHNVGVEDDVIDLYD